MTLHLFLFALSALLLWFGAEWIVTSASAIARKFKVSELVIGLTIVALGTSAPEFLVTANAAFKGLNDISLANIVGSNIFNLGFILGIMAIIRPLPTHKLLVYRDGLLLFLTTALILVLSYFNALNRISGIILLAILATYLFYLGTKGKKLGLSEESDEAVATWKDYPKLLVGFMAIALGGHFMVEAAKFIATALGVSQWAIGMTIVAAGTSLPEMITCLSASMKGKNDMLLGNLIGSDFFNFAGVLGLTCLLKPLQVSPHAVSGLAMLVGMVGLVLVLMRTNWKLTRLEGTLLLGISLFRWFQDYMTP